MNGSTCFVAAVALRDLQVVLERLVRSLERVLELEALEDVVVGPRLVARPVLQVHGPADRPDPALLALDPDHDPLLGARVVDAVEARARRTGLPASAASRPEDTIAAMAEWRSRSAFSFLFQRSLERGAGRRVRDPRARPRAVARGDPRGPLRPEPAHAASSRPGCSTGPSVIRAIGDDDRPQPRRPQLLSPSRRLELAPDAALARALDRHGRDRDVPGREPVRLEDDDVVVGLAARRSSPATTSCSSCTSSQSSTPAARRARSGRPTRASRPRASRSRRTPPARARRCRARARSRSFAPTAQTSAPGASHSPRSTGSREVVTVTTTSRVGRLPVALGRLGADAPSQNACEAARASGSRRRPARSPARAARMHATCVSACQPQPITPRLDAPGRARCLAATPLAAPVRSCPSRSASITATSSGASARKRHDDEARAGARSRVGLHARVAELAVDRGHDRERAVLERAAGSAAGSRPPRPRAAGSSPRPPRAHPPA